MKNIIEERMNAPVPGYDPLARLVVELDRHDGLAVAVSGGVDSMTLAHVAWRFSAPNYDVPRDGPRVPAAARDASKRAPHSVAGRSRARRREQARRPLPPNRSITATTAANLCARSARQHRPIASGTNRDDLDDFRSWLTCPRTRCRASVRRGGPSTTANVYTLAASLGLDDLERLPAPPCCSRAGRNGIAAVADDLTFIDAFETRLAAHLGTSVLRCR